MADLERRLVFSEYQSIHAERPFDRSALSGAFERLRPENRVLAAGAFAFDVVLTAEGDEDTPTQLQILRLRDYENRPYVYAPGQALTPVNIASHESITDVAHVILWPDGYVALDQGGHAPPLSALHRFLPSRCEQWVRFVPLYDRQIVQRLQAIRHSLRRVEIGIENSSTAQADLDQQLPPLRGLFATYRGRENVSLRAEVKVNPRGRGARARTLPEDLSDQLLMDLDRADELLDTYRVSGRKPDGTMDHIDLISERLHVTKMLPRAQAGGHMPDSDATFRALLDARAELDARGALEAAARGTMRIDE